MQQSLDQTNVRVHRAVSDIDGVTGMVIRRTIVDGERDAGKLAKLRDPRCHILQWVYLVRCVYY
jgi:transposase